MNLRKQNISSQRRQRTGGYGESGARECKNGPDARK